MSQEIYQRIEDDIIARILQGATGPIEVIAYPDVEADVQRPGENGQIRVLVFSSKFEEGSSKMVGASYIEQAQEVEIYLECTSMKRRGPGGAFDLWETVECELLGFKPSNCDRLFLKEAQLAARDKEYTLWTYAVRMGCMKMITQVCDDENDAGPKISSISFNDQIS